MKHMKKLLAMLLAVMMVMGLATTAFAATVSNATTGHSYLAYQVFKGTQAPDDAVLGDIEWGDGVDDDGLLTELKEDYDYFDSCTTAADVAKVLENKSDDCDEAKALAATATKHLEGEGTSIAAGATKVTLAAGYWLLVDVTEGDDDNNSDTEFARNAALLQVTNDGDITIGVKYDTPEVDKTVDDNDADIGDTVTFTLTGTMPSTLEGYETYKVIFNDTLSAGLTYTNNVKVTIDGTVKTTDFTVSHEYGKLTVSCNDVLALGAKESSKIVVTYTAVLNENAVIGTEGNPNTVYLTYSNDPNWDGTGDSEPTGDTPEKEVKVYTWEIPVFKYTGTNTALAGAVFSLYTDEACTDANIVNLVSAGENVYKVCMLTDGQHDSVEDVDHATTDHVTTITTPASGKIEIEGLEKGTYYLKEITAPAGYNLLKDAVKVEIGENGALKQNGTATEEIAVENNAGATLPETGGVGTTIFYVLGAVLVLAAVVLLVTKRRMGAAE